LLKRKKLGGETSQAKRIVRWETFSREKKRKDDFLLKGGTREVWADLKA